MKVELSDDEALVLFELLNEYRTKDDGRAIQVQHAAERNALWALSAALEKQLVAPFEPAYADILSLARARLELEANGCILVGDPTYYIRFGFRLSPSNAPAGEPAEFFMVKLFGRQQPTGPISFHGAFASTSPRRS